MGKNIPDRWQSYSNIGKRIRGTSIICFKVPLHKRICENLPRAARFTTTDVMDGIRDLGLVINLTNTDSSTRYYEPNDFKENGIEYKWIKVEGRKTPSRKLLLDFCRTVKRFEMRNPSKLIGIHCTHGLNRTGYFVCSYMVLVLSMSASDAIRRFTEARGHEIERENYISAIVSNSEDGNLKRTINDHSTRESHESAQNNRSSNDNRHRRKANYDRDRYYDSKRPRREFYHDNRDNSEIPTRSSTYWRQQRHYSPMRRSDNTNRPTASSSSYYSSRRYYNISDRR